MNPNQVVASLASALVHQGLIERGDDGTLTYRDEDGATHLIEIKAFDVTGA